MSCAFLSGMNKAFVALVVLLASSVPASRELRWRVGRSEHKLGVGAPVESWPGEVSLIALSIPGSKASSTWNDEGNEASSDSERFLLSVVGPIVSRYFSYSGYHGAGGWVSQLIETELLDGYQFDLRAHLAAHGGIPARLEKADFSRYWIASWDGKDSLVLGVQVSGCENNRSSCSIELATVTTTPPAEWIPWLEAAKRGEGFLQRECVDWWVTLRPRAAEEARKTLASLPTLEARRKWIAEHVYRQAGAPGSAAALIQEVTPLARFNEDAEVQWSVADRLLYLVRRDQLDPREERQCIAAAREALSRKWEKAPGGAALFNAIECVKQDASLRPETGRQLGQLLARCKSARAPIACAHDELWPLVQEPRPEANP